MSSRGAVIGAPTRDDESQRLLYEHEPESIPSMPTLQSHRPLFELCDSKQFKLSAAGEITASTKYFLLSITYFFIS